MSVIVRRVGPKRLLRYLLASAALAVVAPGAANAVTFGADLSQPANVTFGCEEQPFTPPLMTGASSCSWTTAYNPVNTSQSEIPPTGAGTITQVSVKVGPMTGAMKVVIMRGELNPNNNNVVCCTDIHESQVFTPHANAITAVPVNLPVLVQTQPDPNNGLETFDLVGLSVLELGVPIPATNLSGLPILQQPSDYDHFPEYQPGQTDVAGDPRGYQLLLQGVWTSGSVGGGGGTLPPAPSLTSKIKSGKHKATFTFKSSGATGYQCALFRRKKGTSPTPNFASCNSPKTYKHLKAGKYTFEVRARNAAGTGKTDTKKFRIR